MPPTPESLARENIDAQLAACGWTVQDRARMNLYAGRGIAEIGRASCRERV